MMSATVLLMKMVPFMLMLVVMAVMSISLRGADGVVVDDDGGSWADYTSIQEAINASSNGDTIVVYNGTYYENVTVNRIVNLTGNGSSDTIIDGQDTEDVVRTVVNWVNISGFLVRNADGQSAVNVGGKNTAIDNCTIEMADIGVDARWAESLTCDNLTVSDCTRGIYLAYSHESTVKWSELSDCSRSGIDTINSHTLDLNNLSLLGCGLSLDDQNVDTHVIDNCTVNGQPVHYYVLVDDLVLDGLEGDLIVGSCDNIVVSNFTSSNSSTGLSLAQVNGFTLSNSYFNGHYRSILVEGSTGSISNVTIENSTSDYIALYTWHVDIDDVHLSGLGPGEGIYFGSQCHNITVTNSTIDHLSTGIRIRGENITVDNVTAYGPVCVWADGLRYSAFNNCSFEGSGLYIYDSHNITVTNCSMYDGSKGVYIDDTNHVTVTYCEIFDHSNFCIQLAGDSRDNLFHHNNIADGVVANAYDDTGDNTWDDGISEGNWWDDWNGSGPYTVDGGAEDAYPLSDPVETTAPEKVPEFGLLLTVTMILALMVIIRRRR